METEKSGIDHRESQQITEKQAKESYECFPKGYKELIADSGFLRFALGYTLFRKYYYDQYLKTLSDSENDQATRTNIQSNEEECISEIDMFTQLLKGESLIDIFQKNRKNISSAQHYCGNLGHSFIRFYPESEKEKQTNIKKKCFSDLVKEGKLNQEEANGQLDPDTISDGVIDGYLNIILGAFGKEQRTLEVSQEAKQAALEQAQEMENEFIKEN